jgi:hypothetical protein
MTYLFAGCQGSLDFFNNDELTFARIRITPEMYARPSQQRSDFLSLSSKGEVRAQEICAANRQTPDQTIL